MDNYRTETVSSNIIVYRWTILLSLTFVIIMEFFVDNSTSRILSVLALAFAYAISFLSNSFMGKVPRWLGICAVIVVLCLLGSIFYPAEYSQSYGIQAFLILFLLVNISYNSEYFVDDSASYDLIYYVIFFLTIAYSLICYSKSGIDGIANMLNDGNLTSVWWLLCFMLALKRSHIMLGVRIVQPHNSIINLFLRIGLIPTIIYVYCLSQLLKSLNHEENVAYIFSFIISAMFLPLLLSSGWLIAWFLVLLVPSRETKKIREVWHKR